MQSLVSPLPSYHQLVSVAQLTDILSAENLVLLDASIPPVGGAKKPSMCWPNTVITGAKRLHLATDFSDGSNSLPYTFPSEEQFNQQAQKLGINHDSQIVIYDDLGIFSSTRVWWMFKAMGHTNVAVLNGGLPLWLSSKRPTITVDNKQQSLISRGDFTGELQQQYFCDQAQVKAALSDENKKVLDARGQARFSGVEKEPRAGMLSGHMQGASNLPYKSILVDGCLLEVEQLQALFFPIAPLNKSLVTTCGSGISACILAMAAELCGYTDISVYDGSWSEWGKIK
jgi:thiosulfate/3-mercaptopyruvate sulfurtransferase